MDIGSGILQLAAVALGGVIAAITGRAPRVHDSRAESLRLLMRVRDMRRSFDIIDVKEGDEVFSELRIALAGARVSWALIDEHQNVSMDSIKEANALIRSRLAPDVDDVSDEERVERSRNAHPSRLFSRPYVKYGEVLEVLIREQLEKPVRAKLLRPWRRRYLNRLRADLPDSFNDKTKKALLEIANKADEEPTS